MGTSSSPIHPILGQYIPPSHFQWLLSSRSPAFSDQSPVAWKGDAYLVNFAPNELPLLKQRFAIIWRCECSCKWMPHQPNHFCEPFNDVFHAAHTLLLVSFFSNLTVAISICSNTSLTCREPVNLHHQLSIPWGSANRYLLPLNSRTIWKSFLPHSNAKSVLSLSNH